jgi:hypothetical protein
MSEDKTWMHRAFPTLSPAQAEELVGKLSEPEWHDLCGLMAHAQRDDKRGRALADMARIYSLVISNLLAASLRKQGAHQKRWLLWRLCGGKIDERGVIKALATEIGRSPGLCSQFGFPAGPKPGARKKRLDMVGNAVKEMRKVVRAGGRPFVLTAHEVDQLETLFEFDDLDAETGETVSPEKKQGTQSPP